VLELRGRELNSNRWNKIPIVILNEIINENYHITSVILVNARGPLFDSRKGILELDHKIENLAINTVVE